MLLAAPATFAQLLLAAAAAAAPLLLAAPAAAAPLLLEEVLESSRTHAPQVLEALARVRGAEGKRLSAEAAFDTVFSATADTRITGYYDGRDIDTKVSRPLADWGGQVYAGYRVSGGKFPIYEDKRYTNQLGEIRAGAVFALLRDRMIDDRRFGRLQADADIVLADADRLMIAIGVQARATQAYNNWVASGLRLAIYRDLLALAEGRQKGFQRQVQEGMRPSILLTENEQNILRRRTLVAQAEQALAQAAQTLSLYVRSDAGLPVVVADDRLPPALAPPLRRAADPRALVAARPDLRTIDIRIRQAGQRLALDRNALQPRLDVNVEAAQDLGPVGAGGPSRSGTDARIGLTFTLPLEQRAARGRIAQTKAEIDAFQQRRRFTEDQIMADIASLDIAAKQAAKLVALAGEEADRAETMAAAERRRYTLGASDFFLVNVREEAAADARVRRLDAAVRQVAAHTDLVAATADLEALGL